MLLTADPNCVLEFSSKCNLIFFLEILVPPLPMCFVFYKFTVILYKDTKRSIESLSMSLFTSCSNIQGIGFFQRWPFTPTVHS